MGDLSSTYKVLGRHADALAMGEQALEFRRRVLPANHPDIGEGCAGRDGLHAMINMILSQVRHCTTSVSSTRPAVRYLARLSARVRRCAYGRHRCPQDTNMLRLLKAKFVA